MGFVVEVVELPDCDICGDTAHYDARLKAGPWAYVCQKCFEQYSTGRLGTGYGQRLILKSVRKEQ